MKALIYTAPERLSLRDVPEPRPGAGELLVRIDACGICGSDMHAFLGHDDRRPAPLTLGHEAAGVIAMGARAGERVAINPLVSCMGCAACLGGRTNLCAERQIISMPPRSGGFAELVSIPERNVVPVPGHVPLMKAALAEPIATAYHAIGLAERGGLRPTTERRAIVLGGGAIGMAAALVLRSRGASEIRVCEPNAGRRAGLDKEGFASWDPARSQQPAASADIVVDAVGGSATRQAASRLAAPGGAIVHIGLLEPEGGLDMRRLTLQEIDFVGSYTYTMLDFRKTVEALAAGVFGSLDWTEERPLAEGEQAFDDIRRGRVAAAKIILRP